MSFLNFAGTFETWFTMPIQPSSVIVAVLLVYWSVVALGALDVEFLDWDFDLNLETDANVFDIGLVPLRFLNLGSIPVMIWVSLYALAAWFLSMAISLYWAPDQTHGVVIAEAFGLAMLVTKFVTNPLKPIFETTDTNRPESLIGQTCTITSMTVTASGGEASYATGQAPLILTVRCLDGELERGHTAEITEYSKDDNAYFVCATNEENK